MDKNLSNMDIDQLYIEVTSKRKDKTISSNSLSRPEFLECILRMAVKKYQSTLQAVESIDTFLGNDFTKTVRGRCCLRPQNCDFWL